jgi:hypothetical protein
VEQLQKLYAFANLLRHKTCCRMTYTLPRPRPDSANVSLDRTDIVKYVYSFSVHVFTLNYEYNTNFMHLFIITIQLKTSYFKKQGPYPNIQTL